MKGQIYLGDEEFVSAMQDKIEISQDDWNIPKKKKRALAESLSVIAQQAEDRNSAIMTAYATRVYSQREIGEYFDLHPSTVVIIVRRASNS
ncbi:hypothetical protein AU255_01870 [Methyloprofundus sedimenti]|uniref:Uncharacterized protein n=1 Tax=Methyloprofundus sedimenti TaxID=1420851 RepID=A0A1V8M592_9GAMM|nr:hypothetical protein [Methyloprofundus sedimenti]OQK16678.1 hypothetical protein AU255_01870 [Methyloprofundus sedimenti]